MVTDRVVTRKIHMFSSPSVAFTLYSVHAGALDTRER